MSLALTCFVDLSVCIPVGILRFANAMENAIPVHCHPIGKSVNIQLFCIALYSALFEDSISTSEKSDNTNDFDSLRSFTVSHSFDPHDRCATAVALAEALCSIDEDNKHTDQIYTVIRLLNEW